MSAVIRLFSGIVVVSVCCRFVLSVIYKCLLSVRFLCGIQTFLPVRFLNGI